MFAALGVELVHVPCEVHERGLAVVLDERADFGRRARLQVLVARHRRLVDVGLALAATLQQPLLVEPGHRRHDRRVLALLVGALVELVEDGAHVALADFPHQLHDLGLELVQSGRGVTGVDGHDGHRLASRRAGTGRAREGPDARGRRAARRGGERDRQACEPATPEASSVPSGSIGEQRDAAGEMPAKAEFVMPVNRWRGARGHNRHGSVEAAACASGSGRVHRRGMRFG